MEHAFRHTSSFPQWRATKDSEKHWSMEKRSHPTIPLFSRTFSPHSFKTGQGSNRTLRGTPKKTARSWKPPSDSKSTRSCTLYPGSTFSPRQRRQEHSQIRSSSSSKKKTKRIRKSPRKTNQTRDLCA